MANVRIRDQGKLTLKDSDNSNEVSLQSPSTVSADQDFIVPNADGAANTIITTNASGTLSFTDINTLVTSDINWNTTPQYNAITLVSGTGYFINTTSGPTTMLLPASPSVGDFVALKDYAGTFGTNKLTIDRNGSNIQGVASNSDLTTNRASVVLVYVDATKGWLYTVENNVGDLEKALYVTATGGTITTSGDYKIHTFTSSGTFTVSSVGNSAGSTTVDYLVAAGGAAGGGGNGGGGPGWYAGGGGAGGYRESFPNPATGGFPVSAQAYPITVGGGGAGGAGTGGNGSTSTFSTITSAGGGGGGAAENVPNDTPGNSGGSGGGGNAGGAGGAGNSPPVSPSQGNSGGAGSPQPWNFAVAAGGGGGAGGAGSAGVDDPPSPYYGGPGGPGITSSINGSPVTRGGGGGGSSQQPPGGAGGSGGGGAGSGTGSDSPESTAGSANTAGGGGGSQDIAGKSGGSGVVVIRYKYQN